MTSLVEDSLELGDMKDLREYSAYMKSIHFLIQLGEGQASQKLFTAERLKTLETETEGAYNNLSVAIASIEDEDEKVWVAKVLRSTKICRSVLKFLASLSSVKRTGFVSRSDLNSALDILEEQFESEAESVLEVVRSYNEDDEAQNSDSSTRLSNADRLVSTNEAIIDLFRLARLQV